MHGMELQTAVRQDLAVVFLIINNGALGNVWLRHSGSAPLKKVATLRNHDWVRFAESLGAVGRRVERPEDLGDALREALLSEKPFVLDIHCLCDVRTPVSPWRDGPPGSTAPTLTHDEPGNF